MEKLLITRKEAADALSVSVDKLDELRCEKKLHPVYIGTRVYFTPDDLRSFVAGLL